MRLPACLRLPRLDRLARAALPVLLLPVLVQAREGPPAKPLTSFEAGPLAQAPLVIVGTTRGVRTQRQQQIARVEVDTVLRGTPPTRPLTVLVRGPHPASDLTRPEATGFPGIGAGRHVYFLARRAEGVACDFRDAFAVEGALGEAKIAALREEIRLVEIADPEGRAVATRAYLLASLSAQSPWTRTHAARELVRFVRARRDLVDEGMERRLRERLRMRLSRDERVYLQAVAKELDRAPRPAAEARARPAANDPAANAASDPWRVAWRRAQAGRRTELVDALLERPSAEDVERAFWALRAAEPETRRHLVRRLTDLGRASLLPRIRRGYAGEPDRSVRMEILRAVGLLGGDGDVAWLAARAENRLLERTALLALARIRTEAAKAALRAARERLQTADAADAAGRVGWIDYLLSEAFEGSTLMR